MRSWVTQKEAQAALGVSRARVIQLRASGQLVSTSDNEGRVKIDRDSLDSLIALRIARSAENHVSALERQARQAEFTRKVRRERAAREEEKRERDEELRSLLKRAVDALESLAERM